MMINQNGNTPNTKAIEQYSGDKIAPRLVNKFRVPVADVLIVPMEYAELVFMHLRVTRHVYVTVPTNDGYIVGVQYQKPMLPA